MSPQAYITQNGTIVNIELPESLFESIKENDVLVVNGDLEVSKDIPEVQKEEVPKKEFVPAILPPLSPEERKIHDEMYKDRCKDWDKGGDIDTVGVIHHIRPTSRVSMIKAVGKDEQLFWPEDETPIPIEVIEAKRKELTGYYDYVESRQSEYVDVKKQLDLLWHDMNEGRIPGKEDSKWFVGIKEIKEKYPKPS